MNDAFGVATAAVSILAPLAPYLAKAGEQVAKDIGSDVWTGAKKLVETIRDKFKGQREAESTLENFIQNPERHRAALTDILREQLEADPSFATEVRRLVDSPPLQEVIIRAGGLGLDITQRQTVGPAGEQRVEIGKDAAGIGIRQEIT